MEIDFAALLRKYMRHVVDEEGSAFLYDYGSATPPWSFSDDEWAHLARLRDEIYAETTK